MARRAVITGMAVMAGGAEDAAGFEAVLRSGRPAANAPPFEWELHLQRLAMRRPAWEKRLRRSGRTGGAALRAALAVAALAMEHGDPDDGLDRETLGVVVAGSNLQQSHAWQAFETFRQQPAYLSPRHGYQFFDSHVMAAVAETVGARGFGMTVGGGMASGNVAVAAALDLIRSRRAAACLVVGPPSDFSPAEWQAFAAMGALAPTPDACRPLDRATAGFTPGWGCAALLIERRKHARARGAPMLAEIAGACALTGADQSPSPDSETALRAMIGALRDADMTVTDIDCVAAHATGAGAGDLAECDALLRLLGAQAGRIPVNALKSLTGHTLQASGLVGLAALVLQINGGFLHGTAQLSDPASTRLRLLGPATLEERARVGLSNAFGFGTIAASVLVCGAGGAS